MLMARIYMAFIFLTNCVKRPGNPRSWYTQTKQRIADPFSKNFDNYLSWYLESARFTIYDLLTLSSLGFQDF
jgi:hypothetical protein